MNNLPGITSTTRTVDTWHSLPWQSRFVSNVTSVSKEHVSCGLGDGSTSNTISSTSSNSRMAQLEFGLCCPSLRNPDRDDRNTTL